MQLLGISIDALHEDDSHKNARAMWRLEKLELAIRQSLKENAFPLVIGGDSSQITGCYNALKQ